MYFVIAPVKGSSPRVWGQVYQYRCFLCVDRIIPTRMGTRQFPKTFLRCHKDHPHAYGDKVIILDFAVFVQGSSPRVWGQEIHAEKLLFLPGIIPTRMGTRTSTIGGTASG